MAVGDVFYGKLGTEQLDFVRVDLIAGHTYSIAMVGLGALGDGVVNPDLILRAQDGTELIADADSGPGLTASLTYTATVTGAYFIDAFSYGSGPGKAYGISVTEGLLPSLPTEMAAGVLYEPGLSWAATPETPVTVTWAVRATGTTYDGLPLEVLSAVQVDAMIRALASFAEVAGISFTQVAPGGTSNAATILVGGYSSETDGASAYASFPGSTDAASADGDIWINNWWAPVTLPLGSLDYMIVLHELGHALGLAHPGDYNGAGFTYAANAQFVQDSHQYTVMSYWDATNTEADSPLGYPATLMMFDIHALQQIYGVNSATRAGNDVYGFNGSLGGAYDFASYSQPQICIWDGAGRDTLDLSGYAVAQRIDLNDGTFSDVGGFTGNVSIALGARIENAVGGSGADEVIGNEFANTLKGGRGNDSLAGNDGNDVFTGGGGKDFMTGGQGQDSFVFRGNIGRDKVFGFDLAADKLLLDTNLWGGGVRTAEQVVQDFGLEVGGATVLNFGANGTITLVNRLVLNDLDLALIVL